MKRTVEKSVSSKNSLLYVEYTLPETFFAPSFTFETKSNDHFKMNTLYINISRNF